MRTGARRPVLASASPPHLHCGLRRDGRTVEDFYKAADPRRDSGRAGATTTLHASASSATWSAHSRHPERNCVNMPGGSGLTALNYVADVHPRTAPCSPW